MKTLREILTGWRPFRAVVVGDFMLDQLVYGNAERLTPEAPVPVLAVEREEDRAGGAANVCRDLAAMRGGVAAFGVVGRDGAGATLRRLLAADGIAAEGLLEDASRPTTVKRSLIGTAQGRHPHRMFRVDSEMREPISAEMEGRLIEGISRALPGAEALCIEDYDKGVCTPRVCREVIRMARGMGVPVLVDPAAVTDYSKYAGATVVTPNRSEAALATGVRVEAGAGPMEHADLARGLLERLGLDAVVVTLDQHGALLVERAAEGGMVEATVVPTVAQEVYDVTGAGDMVLAALTGARVQGANWKGAVHLANVAAGLEVAVFGVVPMPIERIHREVIARDRRGHSGHEKTRTLDELLVEVAALRREGRRVVFTNGCFDVLHPGHLSLLRRAAGLGDFLIVGINTDEVVRKLKGPGRPVYTERDRAEMLGGLECVGAVLVFTEETPERVIRALAPDVLAKGDEYSVEQVPGAQFVVESGGRVELLPMVDGQSTTRTVERMRSA